MIDFSNYKEALSVDAFVSIVTKDIIKGLDDTQKNMLKEKIPFSEAHFHYGLHIRNKYIYPYLETHKFGGKKVPDADTISMMIFERILKRFGGHISDYI